jgi:tetratricopeptide (TPR) repeat protein
MLLACAVLGTVSVSLADSSPLQPPRWDKAVWGYLRMGNQAAAKKLALRAAEEQPDNYRIQSALGLIAASEGDNAGAANYYRRAIELRPNSHVDHYRLARLLVQIGLRDEAVEHAAAAARIAPQPEYRALLQELRAGR